MNCWARYLFYAIVGALAIGQMISACGQKGPLYLAEEKSAPAEVPQPIPVESGEGLEALEDIPEVPPGPDTF